MAVIDAQVFDIGYMDALSRQNTFIHRLDPRAKLITTLVFIVTVVSFGRYELSAMIPFFIYPVFLATVGNVPGDYLLRKILLVSPFAVLLGLFNPMIDRQLLITIGPIHLSGGWISFASILVRFSLTVSAALILVAVTGFNKVCKALDKLGVPKIFVMQLMFLYRYLFVLTDETLRMVRARSLRNFNGKGSGLRVYGSMLGHLLLRTLERAQRIHMAMVCRGFQGDIRVMGHLRFGRNEIAFTLAWTAFFIIARFFNLSRTMGDWAMRIFS